MKKIHYILLHVTSALAFCLLIFYILDIYNPLMMFINNSFTKLLLFVFILTSLASNLITFWRMRPRKGRERRKKEINIENE